MIQRTGYQVTTAGAEPASLHPSYGDAQREAWAALRRGARTADVRVMRESGVFEPIECWTIGRSGKYRWHLTSEAAERALAELAAVGRALA